MRMAAAPLYATIEYSTEITNKKGPPAFNAIYVNQIYRCYTAVQLYEQYLGTAVLICTKFSTTAVPLDYSCAGTYAACT